MFVITADQVDSTHRADMGGETLAALNGRFSERLQLPADRTAGDEVQLLASDAPTALSIISLLTRGEEWSVGCGIGTVRTPLPPTVREATGPAFVAARHAVERAKRAPQRFALVIEEGRPLASGDVSPVIDLLLFLRSRRTPEGWEMFDLIADGLSQADAAARLGISPQAASQRARAAGIRTELAATSAITRLLAAADGPGTMADRPAEQQNGH